MNDGLTPIGNVLAGIFARNQANLVVGDGDFTNEEGLLCCGVCKEPKQCRVDLPEGMVEEGGERSILLYAACKCERDRQEEEQRQRKEYERQLYIAELRSNSQIDDLFADSRFDTFKVTEHNQKQLKISKRYVEKFDEMLAESQGLLFYGDVGTGKSYMSACIANALLDQTYPVMMTSMVKLLGKTQGFIDNENEFVKQMLRVKLLILDDLGAERGTDYALEKVYDIIDSRCRVKLPMIITTNIELAEMKDPQDRRYKRLYDRILGVCYPVQFSGPSFRKKEARRRFDKIKELLEGDDE